MSLNVVLAQQVGPEIASLDRLYDSQSALRAEIARFRETLESLVGHGAKAQADLKGAPQDTRSAQSY
ncbi:hypothetical protein PYCC9005_001757 [Savitreella phatthalungensis]